MDEQTSILKQVNQIMNAIQEEKCYQDLLILRKEMRANQELMSQIDTVRKLQKQLVQSHTTKDEIKKELEKEKENLEKIPLYQTYLERIDDLNQTISWVEDKINAFVEEIILS